VRYIQRIIEPSDLARLAEYLRPEIVGVSAVHDDGARIGLCLTQTQAVLEDVQLSARWGLLPPNKGIDAAIQPVEVPSWIMDIDVFDARPERFDGPALAQRALEHSRRQYRFFRWAVEPAFLLRFGADPKAVGALAAEGPA
jgi:uncharacterized protein (TIGR04255 family)